MIEYSNIILDHTTDLKLMSKKNSLITQGRTVRNSPAYELLAKLLKAELQDYPAVSGVVGVWLLTSDPRLDLDNAVTTVLDILKETHILTDDRVKYVVDTRSSYREMSTVQNRIMLLSADSNGYIRYPPC